MSESLSFFSVSLLSSYFSKILIFIFFFFVFYFLGQFLRKLIRQQLKIRLIQREIITFVSDLSFYTCLVLGTILGLTNIGVNINAIIGGLGLGGFALGLALKDIIANFVSGLLIILSKTIKVGDTLKIAGFEGEVKSVNLRQTVLVNKQNPQEKILVPNSNIYSSIITIQSPSNQKK